MAVASKPIPEGFRTVTLHMVLKSASEAIDFYKKAFGAEELFRMPGPDGKSVMHAEIRIGDSIIFLGEECADSKLKAPTLTGAPMMIHLYVEDVDALFDRAVKAGAKEMMPLQNMFWGDRYGFVQDPFGYFWSIATHIEDLTPEEIEKRAAEVFAK